MTAIAIWSIALILYVLFWFWYVGIARKITPSEIESCLKQIQTLGNPSEQLLETLSHFFNNDDGKDFVMVNLVELKEPKQESRKKLAAYQKIFLGGLLKRAGHPVFIASVASGKIENVACDADNWTAAGMIRYRSRRDLLEILLETVGSEHHRLKLESLQRTFAYPAAPWMIAGGPKIIVPLAIALLAALLHLAILV